MQKLHQKADFGTRALPILTGESKQCQIGNTQFPRGVNYRPDRILAAAMALEAGQPAPRSPTSIAVHHNRDMAREPSGIQ